MKLAAALCAALLGAASMFVVPKVQAASPVLVSIESAEQAAAAISAPLAFAALVPGVEVTMRVAGAAARTVRAAAEGIDASFLLGTAIPATVTPCPAGGSFTLQGTPGVVYVLQVQYEGCKTGPGDGKISETGNRLTEINGQIIVHILATQFGLIKVTRVAFGSPAGPYVQTDSHPSTGFLFHRLALAYEAVGLFAEANQVSPFAHRLRGSFVEEQFFAEGPGDFLSSSIDLNDLVYAGFLIDGLNPSGEFVLGRDAVMKSGSFTSRGFERARDGTVVRDETWTIGVQDLRISDQTNFNTFVRTMSWNGGLNLVFPQNARAG